MLLIVAHAVAILLGIPQNQIEPPLSFVDARGRFSADRRGDDFLHVRHIDPMPRDLAPIDIDGQIVLTEELFHTHIPDAPHGGHNGLNLLRDPPQRVQIVAEDLHGRFGSHAG